MGAVFSIFSGFHYWVMIVTNKLFNLATTYYSYIHFWLFFIGVNLTFFPMHYLGIYGMPRRIPMYPLMYLNLNMICSAGANLSVLSAIFFIYICFKFLYSKELRYVGANYKFFNILRIPRVVIDFDALSREIYAKIYAKIYANKAHNSFFFYSIFDILCAISIFYLQPATLDVTIYYYLHVDSTYYLIVILFSVAWLFFSGLKKSYDKANTISGRSDSQFEDYKNNAAAVDHCPATEIFWGLVPFLFVFKILYMAVSLIFGVVASPIAVAFSAEPLDTVETIVKSFGDYINSINLIGWYNGLYNNDSPELVLNVTASQWNWSYNYASYADVHNHTLDVESTLSEDIRDSIIAIAKNNSDDSYDILSTNAKVVVPLHSKITVTGTSTDVAHSWSIPALGVKMDCIPGRIHTLDIVFDSRGMYKGQCSEFCGVGHGFMPIEVYTCDIDDYFCFLAHKASEQGLEDYRIKYKGDVINTGPVDSAFWRYFFEGIYSNKFWAESDNYVVESFNAASTCLKLKKLIKTFPTIKFVTYQYNGYPYMSKKMVSHNIEDFFSLPDDDYYTITRWVPAKFRNSYYIEEFKKKTLEYNSASVKYISMYVVERAEGYLCSNNYADLCKENLFRPLAYGITSFAKEEFYKESISRLEKSPLAIDKWALNGKSLFSDSVTSFDFTDEVGGGVIQLTNSINDLDYFNYVTLTMVFKNRVRQLTTNINFPTLNLFDSTYKYDEVLPGTESKDVVVYSSGIKEVFKTDYSMYWAYLNYRFNGSMPDFRDVTFLVRYLTINPKNERFVDKLYSRDVRANIYKHLFDSPAYALFKNNFINFYHSDRNYYLGKGKQNTIAASKPTMSKLYKDFTLKLYKKGKINLNDCDHFKLHKNANKANLSVLNFGIKGTRIKYRRDTDKCTSCYDKFKLRFIWTPRDYLRDDYSPKLLLKHKLAYSSKKDVYDDWFKS